jgi:protein TonB
MFNQLLESKPHRQKPTGSTAFSIIFHSALIAAAVWATANAAIQNEKPKLEKITYVKVKTDEPPPPPPPKEPLPPPPKDATIAPPPPKGFQVLKAPVDIPTVIPQVDLSRRATNEEDFSGKGVAGGIAKGVVGGTGPIGSDAQTYYAYQVEKPAQLDNRSPRPLYPETLRGAGIEGEVDAQFVVDTNGRAEIGSFKVVRATNDLFSAAVRAALPKMHFLPAEAGGRRVRQLVELPFNFTIQH